MKAPGFAVEAQDLPQGTIRSLLRHWLACPASVRRKALPVAIIQFEKLKGLAVGEDFSDLSEVAIEGIFEADTLPSHQRHDSPCWINDALVMEDIAIVGTFRPADVLEELRPGRGPIK